MLLIVVFLFSKPSSETSPDSIENKFLWSLIISTRFAMEKISNEKRLRRDELTSKWKCKQYGETSATFSSLEPLGEGFISE